MPAGYAALPPFINWRARTCLFFPNMHFSCVSVHDVDICHFSCVSIFIITVVASVVNWIVAVRRRTLEE